MRANPWDPEVVVDAPLARHLIDAHFPELGNEPLSYVGAGWDNTAWRVGDWVFRFPRRGIARALLHTEIEVLRDLADALPLPISAPTYVGTSTPEYPFPWAGYRWLDGQTGCTTSHIDAPRSAQMLGLFLRALHEQRAPAPMDEWRFDVPAQAERLHKLLSSLDDGVLPHVNAADAACTDLARTPLFLHPPVLCHGDLYARHVLFRDGLPCGVIDWGDVHNGDRATDLAVAYMLFDPPDRERLFDAYGPLTEPMRRRARFRALYSGVHQAAYGAAMDDQPMLRAGRNAVARALASDSIGCPID